jgi:AcrR family transcriptional regulator
MSTMPRDPAPVKAARRYDSSRRREQSRETRARVLDAARRLFLRGGYGSTTVAAIAAAAGVSVETVYKTYGGKAGLVRAIRDSALAGDRAVPAEQRSDELRAREPDPRKVVAAWGTFTTEIMPRVAPILLLVRAAGVTDPEMASLQREMDDARLARMNQNATYLHEGGHLRDGVTRDQARDLLFLHSSPELYELLVLRQSWALEDYGRFVGESLAAALLAPPAAREHRRGS